ncbi:MAG: hypothetical protein NZ480_07135 [Bdellovibrionaceae bacterium]|nr:hypothetical protein [Pseudobdellovibrionaceae bacterium]MDW8190378.1 hypothetical protein [Pseudobdellovibrionaceae bacterium]
MESNKKNSAYYTKDPKKERKEQFVEILLLPPHQSQQTPLFEIWYRPLAKEFKNRYQEIFIPEIGRGELMAQEQHTAYNRKIFDQSQRRQQFAEFMAKRLIEYHVDQYFRNDPSMRKVYEIKEQLQNVELKVSQEAKIHFHYSLTGNFLETIIQNPYFDELKVIRRFGGNNALLPGTTLNSTEVRVAKALSLHRKWLLLWEEAFSSVTFNILEKQSENLNTFYGFTLSGSTNMNLNYSWSFEDQINALNRRDTWRVQGGFGWSF